MRLTAQASAFACNFDIGSKTKDQSSTGQLDYGYGTDLGPQADNYARLLFGNKAHAGPSRTASTSTPPPGGGPPGGGPPSEGEGGNGGNHGNPPLGNTPVITPASSTTTTAGGDGNRSGSSTLGARTATTLGASTTGAPPAGTPYIPAAGSGGGTDFPSGWAGPNDPNQMAAMESAQRRAAAAASHGGLSTSGATPSGVQTPPGLGVTSTTNPNGTLPGWQMNPNSAQVTPPGPPGQVPPPPVDGSGNAGGGNTGALPPGGGVSGPPPGSITPPPGPVQGPGSGLGPPSQGGPPPGTAPPPGTTTTPPPAPWVNPWFDGSYDNATGDVDAQGNPVIASGEKWGEGGAVGNANLAGGNAYSGYMGMAADPGYNAATQSAIIQNTVNSARAGFAGAGDSIKRHAAATGGTGGTEAALAFTGAKEAGASSDANRNSRLAIADAARADKSQALSGLSSLYGGETSLVSNLMGGRSDLASKPRTIGNITDTKVEKPIFTG